LARIFKEAQPAIRQESANRMHKTIKSLYVAINLVFVVLSALELVACSAETSNIKYGDEIGCYTYNKDDASYIALKAGHYTAYSGTKKFLHGLYVIKEGDHNYFSEIVFRPSLTVSSPATSAYPFLLIQGNQVSGFSYPIIKNMRSGNVQIWLADQNTRQRTFDRIPLDAHCLQTR
jgi:hypothetical protein